MAYKDILEGKKNITDADSNDENEMHNAAPVPTSSEMRNIMQNMHSLKDSHSMGEMNDIEQLADNLVLKTTISGAHRNYN
ncbi:hypothetical protein TNCV_2859911 [Trichonephila clavipes]|nr:hypothetical protein TNCV_2859911 [Trichonephila clavipes]